MLSIDDYYMTEVTEEKTDERGVRRKMSVMKYQHDADMEEVRRACCLKMYRLDSTDLVSCRVMFLRRKFYPFT